MSDKLLQANLKAAELLGKEHIVRSEGVLVKCEGDGLARQFSIANPSDRDAVVQMLGEKHLTYVKPMHVRGEIGFLFNGRWQIVDLDVVLIESYDTYQDAVMAAILSI